MPSFGSMLEVVDLLHVKAITVEEDKCVAVRNRNSSCHKCVDACINQAISVARNELAIDYSACVNCGCCVPVCPTYALHTVEPTSQGALEKARKTGDETTGCVVYACARKASKHEASPDGFSEVPCLGHVNEVDILSLAASGFDDIVLVDGDCASCKYGAASPRIEEAIGNAVKLIEASGSSAIVTRSSEFPPELFDKSSSNIRGKDRRGIISQTGSYVMTVAGNVASKAIDERLGVKQEPLTLHARLSAGKNGMLPTFGPTQNYRIVEYLERLGFSDAGDREEHVVDTRHFGNVVIDPEKCSGCGMCVMFCPTGALKAAEYDFPEDPSMKYLEFRMADCTQCMLCKDVCLRYCLEVESKVDLEEVFDLEPQLLTISKPQKTSFADIRLRNKK